MTIPKEAVEAAYKAARAVFDKHDLDGQQHIEKIVDAAAPILAARALRDEADLIDPMHYAPDVAPYIAMVKANIIAAADELDPQ